MRVPAKKTLVVMLSVALLMILSHAVAHEQSQGNQTSKAEREAPVTAPDLADIIPLAAKLSGRLAALEIQVKRVPDISAFEKKYAGVESNLRDSAGQLQLLNDSQDYRQTKLVQIKEEIEQVSKSFTDVTEPINDVVRQLGAWRADWLAEKKRWNEWRSSLLKEGALDQLESAFVKADATIDAALNLILPQLEAALTVQEKAGNIRAKIEALAVQLDSLILTGRHGVLLEKFPPMFSPQYFSQFRNELWYAVKKGLRDISWPDSQFYTRHGWTVFIQCLVSLIVMIAIFRKRQRLYDSKHGRFLAARPFSAGFFSGIMATLVFYEYAGVPATWKLAYTLVGGISFARLIGVLVDSTWKRQFVYGLMIVLIVTGLVSVVSLPLPLFRIYMVLAALLGLLFCLRWAGEIRHQEESNLYAGLLWLGSFFLTFIILAELWGKSGLAEYLFVSLVRTMTVAMVFMLFMHMIRGGLAWLLHMSPLRRVTVMHENADAIIRRVATFIDVTLCGLFLLPLILMIWRVFDNLEGATKGLLAIGLDLGSQRITVGLMIVSAGILYGSFLASWIFQKLLMDGVLLRHRVERGVRVSIGRLINYVLIFVGFLLALLVLGFDFTKITIMLSALGVGIGFGLQGIVNNFVSGLVLLFERPVRVGDYIEFGGSWAVIKRIGLRATIVKTFGQADVIIPNADLVTNQVTNWTLSDRLVRVVIPVGVAYGSDVPLVLERLMACAKANSSVAETPLPQVLFLKFGESSLDFELRVWVLDADIMLTATSQLHQEIDRSFREAKIEIAFPHRDLHLRNLDKSVILGTPKTTE